MEELFGGMEPEEDRSRAVRQKIKKAVKADIQRANSYYTEKVEPILRTRHQIYEADRDYYARRFPETAKQSDFVSYDMWSMVQWAIPAVMNSFFGGGDAVVIVGRGPEDVPRAETMKALIEFQIMVQNKGFVVLWDWFSDAFQYGLGAVKVWWKQEGWDPLTGQWAENRPVLESVRVTDLRWSPEARNLDEANFVAQRKTVTADHLRRQALAGIYDAEAVERAIEGKTDSVTWTAFETELNDELEPRQGAEEDPARALFELYECYVKLDVNDDGLLEDAIVTVVDDEILRIDENPWGRAPIFTLSPIRDPFRVLAPQSFSEIVGEIQSLKVALMRQFIINTVNANNARFFVAEGSINVDDVELGRQFIRVPGGNVSNVIMPFPQAAVAPWTMNFFEYLEGAMEQWTGRTRYNQGTDGKSLNKTATGISLLQQASEQRIDYIVRVFAETGVGEMMRFFVRLNQSYIDQPQVIRLRNEPLLVPMDDLNGEFDIDVNTEAGVGKKKQTIQNLQFYLSAIAPTGMQIGAVTPGEWAKAAIRLLQESGIRDPQSYVLDPDVARQQFYAAMMQQMAQQAAQQALTAQTGGALNDRQGAGRVPSGIPGGPQMGGGMGGLGGIL